MTHCIEAMLTRPMEAERSAIDLQRCIDAHSIVVGYWGQIILFSIGCAIIVTSIVWVRQ
jgi:hypothetical protein